jgi:hypothetical protein
MTATVNEISRIIVLINIDDPATKDTEFQNRVQYGNFARKASAFTEENRAQVRRQAGNDPVADNKFFIEVYTDRLSDFVNSCVVSDMWQRCLIFQRIEYIQPPPDVMEGISEDELEEYTELVHYYELKTLRKHMLRLDTNFDGSEDEDLDDEEVSSDSMQGSEVSGESDAEDEEIARDMDNHSSLFLPASGTVH